jgi:hypothetical protein
MMAKLNIRLFSEEFNRLIMIYDKDWSEEKITAKSREYYAKLQNLSEESFKTGIEKCINQHKYFPSISEMLEQCRITRGSQEVKFAPVIANDNSALDRLFDSLREDEQKDIKQLAAELMKKIGMLPTGYKKGANAWHDSMLNSTFKSSFKYIVLRKYFKEECIKFGYRWKGECLSTNGWRTFEQAFRDELKSA